MKSGVEIPGTVEEAVNPNGKNGNSLCQDYIQKYIKNSCIAFKPLERHGKPPVGYTGTTCHLVFDLNMDMKRKAWCVAGGHLMDVPTHMIYLIVVYRDTVHIGFLMPILNELDIIAGDIQNVLLGEPTQEKIFFYAGN